MIPAVANSMLGTFTILAAVFGQFSWAAYAAELPITLPESVKLTGDSVLIVTHASTQYDLERASKPGLDRVVAESKARGIPVVYLVEELSLSSYFFGDWNPTYAVESIGGSFYFRFPARHVILSGGFVDLCLKMTWYFVWKALRVEHPHEDVRITYPMAAVYDGRYQTPPVTFLKTWNDYKDRKPTFDLLQPVGLDYLSEVRPTHDFNLELDHVSMNREVGLPEPSHQRPVLTVELLTISNP